MGIRAGVVTVASIVVGLAGVHVHSDGQGAAPATQAVAAALKPNPRAPM